MKHIRKTTPTPPFFVADTQGLTLWRDYLAQNKRKLKKYILENEQFNLCCYCEKQITVGLSHIEHIKPKSLDLASLTFDYANLLVSCEGNHFNEIGDTSKNTCGQFKDDNFDENLFLNATLVTNISEYFIFDDNGVISESAIDIAKSSYTLTILNLNGKNNKLAEARKIAKQAIITNLRNLPIEIQKEKLAAYLSRNSSEFVTFLRYVFGAIVANN
jgi:uncharacterized protein (TIGR02646 family)